MTVPYRNKFTAYKQEHDKNYAPVGSIFPVLVDSYSGKLVSSGGDGTGGESPEYGYEGYLYCDGSEVNIRDYPLLYNAVKTTYGGSTAVTKSAPTDAGGIVKIFYKSSLSKWYIVFNQDLSVSSPVKLPYPYGVTFRFNDTTGDTPPGPGLGGLGTNNGWVYNIFYGTTAPSDSDLSALSGDYNTSTQFIYEITFPSTQDSSTYTQATYTFSSSTHPSVTLNKTFILSDYPYNVGTFVLPDYRDRIVVGVGGVDGEGSPTVENALVNQVGQVGGQWYISKNQLLDGGVFFTVGDVRTRGYSNITSDIFTYLTGESSYRIGPLDDHIFSRPIEHNHQLLSVRPEDIFDSEVGEINWDEFAVTYTLSSANVALFEPASGGGLALGHSHGITRDILNDPNSATYGNTDGIGGQDPNTPANIQWDVSDPFLLGTAVYDDISLEPHGPGTGEWEGFNKPSIATSNRYLAFGYRATANINNPSSLKVTRSVTYTLDFTGFTQFFIFAIAGNDSNGGERPNNPEESLIVEFSDGTEVIILPSGRRYNIDNGDITGFDQYDAIYAYWKASTIDIPAALQNQPNQTVKIKQTLRPPGSGGDGQGTGGVEQGPTVPAGNDNANDMFGIQAIGLRGGITTPAPDTPGEYPITGSEAYNISSIVYDSGNGYALATTVQAHGFKAGKTVQVNGATPDAFNGDFIVLEDQLTANTFTYDPGVVPTPTTATGIAMNVRLSPGSYEDVTETPQPRMYVVNDNTVIGGKPDVFVIPGTGITFRSDELSGAGTINTSPVPASEGDVTRLDVELRAPGGGGGGSSVGGTDGGYAYATFSLDGSNYTVYAYGGSGGSSGDSGGAGGSGGGVLIPAALQNDPRFTWEFLDGADGTTGGQTGQGTVPGGGPTFDGTPVSGSGGAGGADTYTVSDGDSNFTRYTSSGTYTPPALDPDEVSRTIELRVAGGGGGGGNNNANSGCAGTGAIGGSGGDGALITATLSANPSNLQWIIGQGGGRGGNTRDGNTDGAGYDFYNPAAGGAGASNGGAAARGAYGNGATSGSGGGSTGLFFDGAIPIIGAGGGGGGGGSGGGYNGGSVTDGCYAGGSHRNADTNLWARTTAIDFNAGGNGTQGGCTAGGGGGGGGGAGPSGQASGGDAGQAGVGHNGNGGGTGGKRGDSAYRSDYVSASWSTAGNGGSPGNDGGSGYVDIKFTRTLEYFGTQGGGGGQGARVSFTLANTNIAMIVGVQANGQGGGEYSQDGAGGSARVEYGGTEGGGTVEGETTSPAGRYYLCDQSGIPSGGANDGAIWLSSSANGDLEDQNLTPVLPGLGTNNTNKFSMNAGAGAPTYNGFATKYIPFTGNGTREYSIGPMDLRYVNRIRFTVKGGNNFNGGSTPEEDLLLYWKTIDGATTNLLDTIIAAAAVNGQWQEVDVTVPESSNARDTNIELIMRQTRTLTQGDNDTNTEDTYGISAITLFYDEVVTRVFTPSDGNTIQDIDYVDRVVSVNESGITATEGRFEMSSSTPISTEALVVPENDIPLITRYHRVKYLIKAH